MMDRDISNFNRLGQSVSMTGNCGWSRDLLRCLDNSMHRLAIERIKRNKFCKIFAMDISSSFSLSNSNYWPSTYHSGNCTYQIAAIFSDDDQRCTWI